MPFQLALGARGVRGRGVLLHCSAVGHRSVTVFPRPPKAFHILLGTLVFRVRRTSRGSEGEREEREGTRRDRSSIKFDVLVGSETQRDFALVSAGTHFSEVGVIKDIAFSSDHWPVSVSCAHSKRGKPRQRDSFGAPRVRRRWMPADGFADCVNNLESPPGGFAKQIAGCRSAACDHALPSEVHVVSEELQELLALKKIVTDVMVRRKMSKTIWIIRRKEMRAKRAVGPLLSGCSNHLNWSKVFGARSVVTV